MHTDPDISNILQYLCQLCDDVSRGQYRRVDELFDMTRPGTDIPPEIIRLAESFGLMLIKIEARELHLRKLVDTLRLAETELKKTRDRLARDNVGLRKSLSKQFSPAHIIGCTPAIRRVLNEAEKIADTPVSVLITGETGTGKELIARLLHHNSARHHGPFIALNCAALPESLLESELFGIEKGVATGVDKRVGRIEQSHGGTLFLDEIGDMPLTSQAKLLRVIEEKCVERLGGSSLIPVDFRLVSATHHDLHQDVTVNKFRSDLFFRIKVVHLAIPPLRERGDDIPLLLERFADIHCRKMGRELLDFTPQTLDLFRRYPWPGNIRELENEIERLAALIPGKLVYPEDLSYHIRWPEIGKVEPDSESLADSEKTAIVHALERCSGNKSAAARLLGISREGLRKKMHRYRIPGSM